MRDWMPRAASAAVSAIVALAAGVIGAVGVTGFFAITPAAADGELAVEVMANGEPADSAPGPTVPSGSTVNLRYVITVGSSEPLFDFVVSNLTGDVRPVCDTDDDGEPDGADGHPGPLSNGDSFICVASVVAGEPDITYAAIGRVTAYDAEITETFVHDDAAHYSTIRPTTTQPPTTKAPTTSAPTTSPPTTQAPSTATTAASTSTISEKTTTSVSTSTTDALTSSTTATTTRATSSTVASNDEDAASPSELAAVDDEDEGGFPFGWVVLAFAIGGAIATGVTTRLSDKNAAVPDQ